MPHVEQDLLTLPEHLRSPLVFGEVRVVYSLVFYVVSCLLLFVCLSFSILAMALSVYFRFMSLTVPLDCQFHAFNRCFRQGEHDLFGNIANETNLLD